MSAYARLRARLDAAGFDSEAEALRPLVSPAAWKTRPLERLRAAVRAAARRAPRDAELAALAGRLDVLLGEPGGEAALESAAAGSAEAQAWLGEARLRRGDAAGALAPLADALRRDPSRPWTTLHLALARALTGDAAGARKLLSSALRLWRRPAWALGASALLEARWGRPERSVRLLAAALEAAPSEAWSQALLELAGERAPLAAASLRRAGRPDLALLRGRLLLAAGRPAQAASALARLSAPEALLHRGRAALARRRHAPARRLLEAAARRHERPERAALAATLARAARALAAFRAPAAPAVTVCGLGLERPADLSVETLAALAAADVVLLHGDRRDLAEFVEALGPRTRPLLGLSGGSGPALWDAVKAELAAGRRVAYATYGHPLLYSDGFAVVEGCLKEGVPFRVLDAVSALDALLAFDAGRGGALAGGFLALSAIDLLNGGARLDISSPTVLFNARHLDEDGFRRLCDTLEQAYGTEQPVTAWVGGDGLSGERVSRLRTGALRVDGGRLDRMTTLIWTPRAPRATLRP